MVLVKASKSLLIRSKSPSIHEERKVMEKGDFPGGPVVKTLPSKAGGAGSILGQGTKIPHALGPKNQNIKQKPYCNKSVKTLKKT